MKSDIMKKYNQHEHEQIQNICDMDIYVYMLIQYM